jgi:kynurenine formamidase
MVRTVVTVGCVTVMVMAVGLPAFQGGRSGGAAAHVVDQAQMDRWKKELSNWGRWGGDDQLGALNLITPAKRKQAAALVREGFPVSLAREDVPEKAPDNPNPYVQVFRHTDIAAYDTISVDFHGLYHTHYDALAHHFFSDGRMFNGFQHKDFFTLEGGATKNSVVNAKKGVFTRGILMDMPRLKGVPYLEPGTPIYAEDLEAWEKQAGIKVAAGDAVFIRTGRWVRRARLGPDHVGNGQAGLDASVIPWVRKRDVALLASENALGPTPRPATQTTTAPEDGNAVHNFVLVALGVTLIDDCDLDALSEAAAARRRWDFLLTMAPLPLVRGTGAPVNPIALF